ncbi:uncharacterized protein [Euwallacea similis]|uniref:uncharacterized protein isoform X2 n=1 Tax=Euwallacea similis TaxID=1736056 RepID=UPI00344C04C7
MYFPAKSNFTRVTLLLDFVSGVLVQCHAAGYHPVGNPLTTALLLSTFLEVPSTQIGVGNHPDQGPVNPYIALLLSQYGRYLPIHIVGSRGLYYYAAANNYHNNKPFGSYKVYENAK